jgi:Icc-related predicted phosphoesterase
VCTEAFNSFIGMKIIALTDIHGHLETIDRMAHDLRSVDLILLTGDLTHFGREKEAREVITAVQKYNRYLLAVPGNCDHPQVETYLNLQQINLHGRGKNIDGLSIMGLGGSLPCPGHTPNEYNERQLADLLEQGRSMLSGEEKPLILLSHQPPHNTVNDRVALNFHVGSHAVRDFIEKYQPLICCTGHIHEGVGIDTIRQTQIVNPGPLRKGGYTYMEIDSTVSRLEIRSLS